MTALINIDQDVFQTHFPEQGFILTHTLAERPEFELASLLALSQQLPPDCVEYNSGELSPGQDGVPAPANQLDSAETLRRIEACQSWMVLKHVEQDAAYAALLSACLEEVIYPVASKKLSGLHKAAAFIFISSPHSVTPYHFDPEHNFLLQLQGTKTMYQFDPQDHELLPPERLEANYYDTSRQRNLPFQDSFQSRAQGFTLQPGEALFVPSNTPHWVQNGPAVSVSFSITFYSEQSKRLAQLYRLNGGLRRFGFRPRPAGESPRMDRLKQAGMGALSRFKHRLMRD